MAAPEAFGTAIAQLWQPGISLARCETGRRLGSTFRTRRRIFLGPLPLQPLLLAMRRSDVPLEDHPGPDLESRNLGSRHGTGVRSLGSDTPAPFGPNTSGAAPFPEIGRPLPTTSNRSADRRQLR